MYGPMETLWFGFLLFGSCSSKTGSPKEIEQCQKKLRGLHLGSIGLVVQNNQFNKNAGQFGNKPALYLMTGLKYAIKTELLDCSVDKEMKKRGKWGRKLRYLECEVKLCKEYFRFFKFNVFFQTFNLLD